MTNYKIYLTEPNGNYAELDVEGLDFNTVFAIQNVKDISTRKDRTSENIYLKGTKNNNRIFGNLYNLNRNTDSTQAEKLFHNFIPNQEVNCIVYENTVKLFSGTLRIKDYTVDKDGNVTYEAVIMGALVNFFNEIGDKYLNEVSGFTSSTHTYNLATIKDSWNYTTGSTFVYPSIDYGATAASGSTFDPSNFDLRNFRCGIYLKKYFDAIFSNFGYTYTSQFLEDDIFKKAFIPYAEQKFTQTVTGDLFSASIYGSSMSQNRIVNANSTVVTNLTIGNGANNYNYLTNAGTYNYTKISGGIMSTYKFTRDVMTEGYIKVKYEITGAGLVSKVGIVKVGDGLLDANGFIQLSEPLVKNQPYTGGVNTVIFNLPYQQYFEGDEYIVVVEMTNPTSTTSNLNNVKLIDCEVRIGKNIDGVYSNAVGEVKLNDTVTLSNVVPQNIKIKDFLKSILQVFNLYMIQDQDNENGFIIEPFDVFYSQFNNPRSTSIDWTGKVNLNTNHKGVFNGDIPRKYNFKFKEDSDYYNSLYKTKYNSTYGNYSMVDSGGFSEGKDIEITFSPTVVSQELPDDKIIPMIYKGEPETKETVKSNLRLLYNNGLKDCKSYNISLVNANGVTVIDSGNTTYNASHHILYSGTTPVFNLQFGVPNEVYFPEVDQSILTLPNIYSTFYSSQIRELVHSEFRIIECEGKLNEIDIANFDFRTPVFVDSAFGHSYFKVISIEYFNSKEVSKISLQKVNL